MCDKHVVFLHWNIISHGHYYENYSIFVKNNCQFSLCFLFLLPSQKKKKRRQGISEEIDGD